MMLPFPSPNHINAKGSNAMAGNGLNIEVSVSRKSLPICVVIAATVRIVAITRPDKYPINRILIE